jgi:hypothetical protein
VRGGIHRVERERKIGKRDIHVDMEGRNRIERRGRKGRET